jgi:NAD(P)H dehydrogenase (quinone)
VIAVTGANGQLGRLVIRALLKSVAPTKVIATVRNRDKAAELVASGVEVRLADYDRPETLEMALAGVEKVLLISGNAVGKRVPQHRAVIEAARKAGVRLFGYTSVLRAPSTALAVGPEHRETEALIKSSGINWVILRNGWYSENYVNRAAAAAGSGVLVGCAGEGRISAATRADYAAAAAAALTKPDQAGRTYELAGDDSFTLPQFTSELSSQLGRKIAYRNVSEDEFRAALEASGIPSIYAALMAKSDAATSEGALLESSRQLSWLIGRSTTPIAAVVAEAIRDGRLPRN